MQEAEDQMLRAGGDESPFTGEELMAAVDQARVRVIIPKLRGLMTSPVRSRCRLGSPVGVSTRTWGRFRAG